MARHQSLRRVFPSQKRGVRSDVMNKSIEVYPVKRDQAKHTQKQGTKSQASSGIVTNTMSGAPGRQTSLASMPSIRRTVVISSGVHCVSFIYCPTLC